MNDWNPTLYLKFEKERTRPVFDLIGRIEQVNPRRILDIGCGPGNSTRALQNRWPDAEITGLDSSVNMIEQARETSPDIKWIHANAISDLSVIGTYDVVFSNAAIQWMPDHELLVPRLFALLNKGGVLAVQIPDVRKMPIQLAMEETATEEKWQDIHIEEDHFTMHTANYYYDLLNGLSESVYLWETHYHHVMEGHQSIIDWYRSTGMKPYLDRITSDSKRLEFEKDVLIKIEKAYKTQSDGRVLFPFTRVFFLAYK